MITESEIDLMVERFLSWKLPIDFVPDNRISFNPPRSDLHDTCANWPTGTNLLTAEQAKEMLRAIMPRPMEKGSVLDEAQEIVNGERQVQYGKAEDSFRLIANYWNAYLTKGGGVLAGPITAKDVALMMVLLKIARAQGPADTRDNYVDIAGYAELASRMI